MKTRSRKKDIAIIGMSGKFPKSRNISAFWENLVSGKELIHFYSDEELKALGISTALIENEKYVKCGSFVEDPGSFDYAFFGYTKDEAELMDPQIRILHEQVWLALEDAGYNPFKYVNKIGCFLSASDNLEWRAHVKLTENANKINRFLSDQISNKNTVSTLISYSMDLRGPSYFIDTACSSSLAAVHIACRNLLMKECSMAVAGGGSIRSSTDIGYMHEQGMIYSSDGHCKAFDIDSSGTVSGEGVGVVILKRLEDAINDGDHMYGIIRSSSVNNDGNRKIGYTAPSISGQYECIKAAHQVAEIHSSEISYIETHGTATKLGDSVEIEALNKAFDYNTDHTCGVGSLKTNTGHLDAAAGVASLIKATLAVYHKIIPPSLHYKAPNPDINFKSGPFYVNSEVKKWPSDKSVLAGVTSLGIGGTNVHVILEEAPVTQEKNTTKEKQLLLFSAKTKSSIERYQYTLKEFLERSTDGDLADLCYTLKTGRGNFKYRKFVVCGNVQDAVYNLDKVITQKPYQVKEKRGIAFVFPGQGNQYFQMGKQIYLHYPYFKSVMDQGFSILKEETGIDYSVIIGYDETQLAEPDLIHETNYTQPLLFLIEYALAELLIKFGIKPSIMIGHSLGEYVAACISGVFSFEDGLKLILKRADLMHSLEQGQMLSVSLTEDKIKEYITPDISIAAVNTEDSCVISGNSTSIGAVSEVLALNKIPFVRLRTSHAFHSEMMDPILNAYEKELKKIQFSEPKYPFMSCVTGLPIKKQEAVSEKYWSTHLRQTVCFSKGLNFLLTEGYSTYLGIGPGKGGINFLKQHKNYDPELFTSSLLKSQTDATEDTTHLLNALGLVWSSGVDINWTEYYEGEKRNKLSVPGYSFDKVLFPAKVDPIQRFAETGTANFTIVNRDDYTGWIYEQGWKEIKNEIIRDTVFDWTLCFSGDDEFSDELMKELLSKQGEVIFVKDGSSYAQINGILTIDPSNGKDYERLLSGIKEKLRGHGRIVHAWSVGKQDVLSQKDNKTEDKVYHSLLNSVRSFSKNKNITSLHVDFLVNDLFNVTGCEVISAQKSIALAALKVIPKEFENVSCKCIEFTMSDFETNSTYKQFVFSKLKSNTIEPVISVRGNKIWKPFYERTTINENPGIENTIRKNGWYIITGANGGIGKTVARFLVEDFSANLVLITRSKPTEDLWNPLNNGINRILCVQDDLSDLKILRDKISAILPDFEKKINGVFHAAGLGDFKGLIIDRKKADCQEIFQPKIIGTTNLVTLFENCSPDFIILCSSAAATLYPFGQVAYIAANLYQSYFALEHFSKKNVISIQWDTWKETGMAVNASNRYNNSNPLTAGISNTDGINLFKYALLSQKPEIIISVHDLNYQLALSEQYTLKKVSESSDKLPLFPEQQVERPDLPTSYEEPKTDLEKQLCELWKNVLGYAEIGINDDFFELGGDSLKVMTLTKRIHKAFNIEISIGDFFKNSTIAALAKEIEIGQEINVLSGISDTSKQLNQIRL